MTGLVTMLSSAFMGGGATAAADIAWNTAAPAAQSFSFGAGGMWPAGPAQDPLAMLSSKLNLGSMSMNLFSGVAEAIGTNMDAKQRASALALQSKDVEAMARGELIKGFEANNEIMDNAIQTMGAQRLAFAANGMELNFGTPVSVTNETQSIADRQSGVVGRNANMMALGRRKQAAALLEERANVLSQGKFKAAGQIASGMVSAYDNSQELAQRRINRG